MNAQKYAIIVCRAAVRQWTCLGCFGLATVLAPMSLLLPVAAGAQSAPAGANRDLSVYRPDTAGNLNKPPPKEPFEVLKGNRECATTACLTKRVTDLEALVAAQQEKITLLEAALREGSAKGKGVVK